ncbi:NAD(P)/FAD-dependent oxidoreductase [Hyphomonas chukchiensis]|uniref:NAD(P)/FAD-dependent oxidoreductase n=1 Tax=Hyphomonas chukchiensis TaxID=1280947 RepID=UPI0030F9E319
MTQRVAIIGAGLTGLSAARDLKEAGLDPVVFEKSRGLGGRLATRRTELGPIDHGAPGVPVDVAQAAGGSVWSEGPHDARGIGIPGMSTLARNLGQGINVQREITITGVEDTANGLSLTDAAGGAHAGFDAVILAVPSPQAAALLVHETEMAEAIANVRMSPLWTLLLGFDAPSGLSQDVLTLPEPLALAIPMLSKPGQIATERWTVHASIAWSAAHLELDKDSAASLLLKAFMATTGLVGEPDYVGGHRWRYARVAQPLGQPFVANGAGTLLAGGDWALGALASDAVASGRAMARRVLEIARR